MKKLNVKKEIFVVLLIVAIMVGISSTVFATSPVSLNINTSTSSVDANSQSTTQLNLVTESTNTTTTNTITITPTATTNTTSTYQNNTTLPQTGDASDYAIFAVIAIAVVIAIYAYKKVRDYNI